MESRILTACSGRTSAAVILCGGSGKRLGALALHTPKCLLQVGSVPLLKIHISLFHAIGVNTIILCTGHLGDRIKAWVQAQHLPVQVYFCESLGKGTAGSIIQAIDVLPSQENYFC